MKTIKDVLPELKATRDRLFEQIQDVDQMINQIESMIEEPEPTDELDDTEIHQLLVAYLKSGIKKERPFVESLVENYEMYKQFTPNQRDHAQRLALRYVKENL